MSKSQISALHANNAAAAALAISIVGAATILGAYFFQFVLKLPPCPLCLEQRIPYYIAIPLGTILTIGILRQVPRWMIVAGFIALAALMFAGAVLGAYHAGIEWKWWEGPLDCSGPVTDLGGGDLIMQMREISPVRCDQAAWRFLGISLAGYNAIISGVLFGIALIGIAAEKNQRA